MGALPANHMDCCCQSKPKVEVLQVGQDGQNEFSGKPIHDDARRGRRNETAVIMPPASVHCKREEVKRRTSISNIPEDELRHALRDQVRRRSSKIIHIRSESKLNGNSEDANAILVDGDVCSPGHCEPAVPLIEAELYRRPTIRRTHTLVSLASNEEQPDVVLVVGVQSIQGHRGHMQDTFFHRISETGECISVPRSSSTLQDMDTLQAEENLEEQLVDCRNFRGFFGVFDGHGGSDTSKFVETQIFEAFIRHCYEEAGPKTESEASSALRKAFLDTEAAVLNLGRAREWMDGTTAAVVAVLEGHDGLLLVAGNVGDSEILLGRKGDQGSPDFVMLSELHNVAKNGSEHSRVTSEGGKICNNRLAHPKFNPRFCSLSVSRALGDGFFKDAEFTDGRRSGLTAEPYVVHRRLSPLDSFLLLGCDGFFQGVEYLEAVESIFSMLDSGSDPQNICEALVELAQQRGSKDNITVVLVSMTDFPTKC